jgi:phage shock protein PspC (stress-responsive transcriptional regulator)
MTNTFYRNKSKGMVAGVCAGLAEYFGVDPAVLRVIFVLWALSGGSGVMAYIVLWIILPDKATVGGPHQESVRQNVAEIGAEARGLGRDLQGVFGGKASADTGSNRRLMFLGGLIALMGLVFLVDNLHLFGWFQLEQLWPVVLILAGAVLLNRAIRGK